MANRTKELKEIKRKRRIRDKIIRAWLSEDEYKILLEKCEKSDMTISSFMRKIITEGEIKQYDSYSLNEAVQRLNSIGNDINGIAKKVNERGGITGEDAVKLKIQYERLINMYFDKIMETE